MATNGDIKNNNLNGNFKKNTFVQALYLQQV